MAFARKAAVAALGVCASSLKLHSDVNPEPSTARIAKQWSETRLGPPMQVSEACSVPYEFSTQSEWKEPDPPTFPNAGLGARRLMAPIDGMPYQLYLPQSWNNNSLFPYPVHLDLHSHGERKWTLRNSQGFARMLARNQSTSFDNRSCWCLSGSYDMAHGENETDSSNFMNETASTGCPMADCTFADTFPGVVVMPQCWTGSTNTGWTTDCLEKAKAITTYVIQHFNGNAEKVIVSGSVEGAVGALQFASTYKSLVSAVIATDAPSATVPGGGVDAPVFVFGAASHAGISAIDTLVANLQGRAGATRYYRFVSAPEAADPGFATTDGHSADIAYRCSTTFDWVQSFTNTGARAAWGLGLSPVIVMGTR
jgi:hypothetical protein